MSCVSFNDIPPSVAVHLLSLPATRDAAVDDDDDDEKEEEDEETVDLMIGYSTPISILTCTASKLCETAVSPTGGQPYKPPSKVFSL
jgi:hypothetical protein